jgi:hypothetical protein
MSSNTSIPPRTTIAFHGFEPFQLQSASAQDAVDIPGGAKLKAQSMDEVINGLGRFWDLIKNGYNSFEQAGKDDELPKANQSSVNATEGAPFKDKTNKKSVQVDLSGTNSFKEGTPRQQAYNLLDQAKHIDYERFYVQSSSDPFGVPPGGKQAELERLDKKARALIEQAAKLVGEEDLKQMQKMVDSAYQDIIERALKSWGLNKED